MRYEMQKAIQVQQTVIANRIRAEEIQLHRALVGSVKRPIMWRDLRARIEGTLERDESMIRTNITMRIAPDENSFTLDRSVYPKSRVHVIFQGELLIELRCSWQKTDNALPVEWDDLIELPVDDLDRVSFQHRGELISRDDAALLILAP